MDDRRLGSRKKGALENKWTIWFLDESGANLTPFVGKTWSPRGTTPVLHHNMGHWDKVNIISAVGADQRLYFQFKVGEAFQNGDFVNFLRHMLRHIEGRLFIDGGGLHKGEEFYVFLAENADRLRVEPLPPYGFEYNPDEGVWGYLKGVELRSFAPRNTPELVDRLRHGLGKMRRRPRLIGSFFRKSKLPRTDIELLLDRAGHR